MSPRSAWLLQEEIVPRLKSAVPQTVSFIGSEDAEELVQDSIALAAKLLTNVDKAHKRVTPGNIAYYTIQHMKSGRRSTGSSVADVYGSGTQLNGRTRLTSLEEIAAGSDEAGEEIFLFHDVLSNDAEDPSTRAARRLDWQEFVAALPDRERKMVEFVAEGRSLRNAARALFGERQPPQRTGRRPRRLRGSFRRKRRANV